VAYFRCCPFKPLLVPLQGSLQNFAAGFMLLVFRPFKSREILFEAGGTAGVV